MLEETERRGIALRKYYDELQQKKAYDDYAQDDELETTRQLGERM